jgi:uncharacterized protein YjiS (DUF1127 family)
MTTISSTPARSSVWAGSVRWLVTLGNGIAAWWLRRAAIRELRELNDHQLRDIGLMRCDIEGAAKRFTYSDIGPLP